MKLVIHLYNLKFHPLDKSFLFLQFEIIILSLEKSFFYCNLEYQVWNFYLHIGKSFLLLKPEMLSLKLLFCLWKNHFIIVTWNVKSKIIILHLRKSFLLLQIEMSSLKLLFYLWKNHFKTTTWNFNSKIIILPLENSFLLLQPEFLILKLLFYLWKALLLLQPKFSILKLLFYL